MAKRILVADDSVTIQRAFAMVFAGQDVGLIAARTWDQALTEARQHRPDLVIADVHLGDKSGYDLCAAVKGDNTLAGIPVYILASNQVPYDASRGAHAKADGHFLKPFDSSKLIEAVDKILGERAFVPAVSSTSVPVAVADDNTSRVKIEDVAFDDEDSYGEFSIEPTANTSTPPLQKTPPPQVQARPPAPLAGRPLPVTPPPVVVAPPPRPAPPLASAPVPRPSPPAVSAPVPRPSAAMPAAVPPAAVPQPRPAAPARGAAEATPANTSPTAKSMPRPSLIPGVMPPRVSADGPAPAVARPPATSAPVPRTLDFGRTMMGIPAMGGTAAPSMPVPVPRSEVVTARDTPAVKAGLSGGFGATLFEDLPMPPPASPASPSPTAAVVDPPTPIGGHIPGAPANVSERASARVTDVVAAKLAEISARGPQYEAIANLSREIIEQVVWEIVPELAEVMIQEQIDRLAKR